MDIAQTILKQLGGNKLTATTGAKLFVDTGNGLHFQLPARKAARNIRTIRIELNTTGLYNVTFYRIKRVELAPGITSPEQEAVHEARDVAADSLREVFTNVTGLYTPP